MSRDLAVKADAIAQLNGTLGKVLKQVLSVEATRLRQRSVDTVSGMVSLPSGYVASHIRILPIKQNGEWLEGGIQGTNRGVLLSRYPFQQLRAPKKNGRGTKKAGISGSIIRGRRYSQPKFFTIPLKSDNGLGIAVRTGKGRSAYKVLHSLSVNQLLRHNADSLLADVPDNLVSELSTQIETEL